MQFLSEVAAAAITNTSAIFSFISDYGFLLGTIWLVYLVFKPANWWPLNKPAGPSMKASVVVDRPSQLELDLNKALQSRTSERDALLTELADCKRSFGVARLNWLAYLFRVNTERAKLDGHDLQNIRVTVRFTPPYDDDYTLAEEMKKILCQYTGWPVEIDGTNNPLIKPNDEFRVIFESSYRNTFRDVESAFREGELIKGGVGFRSAERDDHEHLIVEVPPRVVKQ